MKLFQYNNIAGKPREGIHSIRLFDFAIMDILFTVLAAYLIARYSQKSFILIFVLLVLLGIFLHWLFCVDTKLNVMIFGK